MLWFYLFITILFLLFLFLGLLILGWKEAIKNEEKIHEFGKTSNGLPPCYIHIHFIQKTLLGYSIQGKYNGSKISYGNILYYKDYEKHIPVFVYNVKVKDKDIELKVFGIKKEILHTKGIFTNVRKESQIKDNQNVDLERIQYPLIVHTPLKIYLTVGLFTLCGLWIAFGSAMMIKDKGFTTSMLVGIITGSVVIWSSLKGLITLYKNKMIFTENGHLIANKKHYHVNDLDYTLEQSQKDLYLLKLYQNQELITSLQSTDIHFTEAYQLIKKIVDQQKKEKLYQYILSKDYYIPLTQTGYIILIDRNNEENKAIMAYESFNQLEKHLIYENYAGEEIASLQEIVKLTKDFTLVNDIILYLDEGKDTKEFIISPQIWKEMVEINQYN